MKFSPIPGGGGKPIERAQVKTEQIQQTLLVAGAELHLTNTALDRCLPHSVRHGDVGRALVQNAAIEEKVQEAAEDLAEVTELLHEEAAERRRLERQLQAVQGGRG
ncbi:hypothetical protein [Ramlibacter tataouinensis]|uniref:Uncharacterized protein n=1 Tax=Ramlibacter tataouinensis (strain ATCC BAA-407 / DSM 14655 / LMG 21543 / TTB310) TaxID=365046 RepID=F5Y3M7_RAMTT|nr:hypothetical protein [Ramlibacter tataouinensis]AEG93684.1 Hypothetical protein Rta_25850 [Ramlibacter tataouinensis TTB310]